MKEPNAITNNNDLSYTRQSPRVQPLSLPHIIPPDDSNQPPRVPINNIQDNVATSVLTTPSNLPKNARFLNTPTHDYSLRSTKPHLILQHLFSYQNRINHIYNVDDKRETVDSLISGPNKQIWLKSLSNE